jgi:hypothetical protein
MASASGDQASLRHRLFDRPCLNVELNRINYSCRRWGNFGPRIVDELVREEEEANKQTETTTTTTTKRFEGIF